MSMEQHQPPDLHQLQTPQPRPGEVQLLRVVHDAHQADLHHWTVTIATTPAPHAAQGLVPDTLEGTVRTLAQQTAATSLEAFALELAASLLDRLPQLTSVHVDLVSHLWKRLSHGGQSARDAFMKGSAEQQTTSVHLGRDGARSLQSGFREMVLLKVVPLASRNLSAPDLYLPSGPSDPLAWMALGAQWRYTASSPQDLAFNKLRHRLREQLIVTCMQLPMRSPLETAHAMAHAALQSHHAVDLVSVTLRHRHAAPAQPSSLHDHSLVFMPLDEAAGPVEVTARRS